MNVHDRHRSRKTQRAMPRPMPEQAAAAYRLGAKWREDWRAEKAVAEAEARSQKETPEPKRKNEEAGWRAKFAEGIARAEFGRFYWDRRRQPKISERHARNDRPNRHECD